MFTSLIADPDAADYPYACGCPVGTPARQIGEHDVECLGCGAVSA